LPGIEPYEGKILLLADASRMEVLKNDDMVWLASEINPQFEEMGITHQAIILPKDFLSQQMVRLYEETSKNSRLNIQVFTNKEDAIKWFINERKLASA
jgi:hypothetical protein